MSETTLTAKVREAKGKSDVRRLRRKGQVPAIIYGDQKESASITIDAHEMELLLKRGHAIISLKVDGNERRVIVRDVQYHPVSGSILHVDFLGVKAGQKITTTVPIHFMGKAPGVKSGGIFSTIKTELDISVLPKNIPEYIEVDVSALEIGDSIRVKNIQWTDGEILDGPEDVICKVELPRIQKEEAEEELIEEEEEAEPEVITAREKEEEE